MNDETKEGFWKKQADKIGIAGTLFAALCCLGFPALLSIVSAIGLGFIINDAVLMPLLVVFLLVALVGLYLGKRHHGSWVAFIIGTISGIALFAGIVTGGNKMLASIGIAGLILASVINVWLRARQPS